MFSICGSWISVWSCSQESHFISIFGVVPWPQVLETSHHGQFSADGLSHLWMWAQYWVIACNATYALEFEICYIKLRSHPLYYHCPTFKRTCTASSLVLDERDSHSISCLEYFIPELFIIYISLSQSNHQHVWINPKRARESRRQRYSPE